jgi:hypothetical protein
MIPGNIYASFYGKNIYQKNKKFYDNFENLNSNKTIRIRIIKVIIFHQIKKGLLFQNN